MLRVFWNEAEGLTVEVVVGEKHEVVASLQIEVAGDAARKILHVKAEHDDRAEVRVAS